MAEGLRRSQHRSQFELQQRWAVRPKDIRRAMLDLNPQIVHFSGHGEGSVYRDGRLIPPETGLDPAGASRQLVPIFDEADDEALISDSAGGLVFEDELGQSKLVSGVSLAALFGLFEDAVECVLLNGCYSASQGEAIAQHVPYVIGMRRAIGDQAAIEFAVGFYDALGAGRSIESAYRFGCSAIQLAGIAEHLTPVLLRKK